MSTLPNFQTVRPVTGNTLFFFCPNISCSCSWITKRLVRQKYCEHVGRELTHEEKLDVNRLVQNFIDRLVHEQKVV